MSYPIQLILINVTLLLVLPITSIHPGHGKELGLHNNLGVPAVEEDYTSLTPHQFYEKYIATRTPVILRGLAQTLPAFHLWTDQYIKDEFGDLEVRLEAKTEKESYIPIGEAGLGRATFTEFMNRYQTDNMYCVSEVPGPMYQDLELPGIMNCGSLKDSLQEMNLWINSGGAKSIIHKDAHNQLNCLLAGSKDWIFINNTYNDAIYQAEEVDGDQGGYSLVNPDQVNYVSFPLFAEVPWEFATVNAGDCLFLPPRYYHRVKSTDRNFAVSYLFGTSSKFENMSHCDVMTSSLPLHDAPIEWKYPGKGMMSMGNSNGDDFRNEFLDYLEFMEDQQGGERVLTEEFIEEIVGELSDDMPYVENYLGSLLREKRVLGEVEYMSAAHLRSLPYEVWKEVAAAFSYDPSNDPDAEMFYISKDEVVTALKELTYHNSVSEVEFITAYKTLNGSTRVGRELFNQLSKDGGVSVTWYDINDNDNVFGVFGKVHDRGDEEMSDRNHEVKQRAEEAMEKSMEISKSEL